MFELRLPFAFVCLLLCLLCSAPRKADGAAFFSFCSFCRKAAAPAQNPAGKKAKAKKVSPHSCGAGWLCCCKHHRTLYSCLFACVSVCQQMEKDMDKWFKRNSKRPVATADGLRSPALQGIAAPDAAEQEARRGTDQAMLSAAEQAQIALSSAAAKLAAQSGASVGPGGGGGGFVAVQQVDMINAAQKLAIERAQARAAAASASQAAASASAAAVPSRSGEDMVALGTNYDTCKQLTIGGKPVVVSQNGKWACLVSRRMFKTEDELRDHIQLSALYRDSLQKATAEGKIAFKAA